VVKVSIGGALKAKSGVFLYSNCSVSSVSPLPEAQGCNRWGNESEGCSLTTCWLNSQGRVSCIWCIGRGNRRSK
jgi:hypothetical protein